MRLQFFCQSKTLQFFCQLFWNFSVNLKLVCQPKRNFLFLKVNLLTWKNIHNVLLADEKQSKKQQIVHIKYIFW